MEPSNPLSRTFLTASTTYVVAKLIIIILTGEEVDLRGIWTVLFILQDLRNGGGGSPFYETLSYIYIIFKRIASLSWRSWSISEESRPPSVPFLIHSPGISQPSWIDNFYPNLRGMDPSMKSNAVVKNENVIMISPSVSEMMDNFKCNRKYQIKEKSWKTNHKKTICCKSCVSEIQMRWK